MTGFLSDIRKIVTDLNSTSLPWCLIGGLACSVYCEPRTTKDIDVAVSPSSPEDLETFVTCLEAIGYFNRQLLMHVQPTHRLGWRLFHKSQRGYDIPLDLLSSSSGIEREVVAAASLVEILPSLLVPIASRAHLIAMKVVSENSSDRIRDRMDLQGLIATATDSDLAESKSALLLIASRGFDRGKDVISVFDDLLKTISTRG